MTKKQYEEFLNELEIPLNDRKSNGGLIPDNCKYGSWLRRNDTTAFQVGYREFKNKY